MQVLFIYCRARSGSYYVHSLFDGHPDVLSLPPLKTTRLFFHSSNIYWEVDGRPKLPTKGLVEAFVQTNATLFDARGRANGQGYDRMGPGEGDALTVSPAVFVDHLHSILRESSGEITRRAFFIAVHQAYDKAVYGEGRQGKVIVYQAHNPLDDLGNNGLSRDFPEAKLLLTMQEAVRSLVSLIYQKNSEDFHRIAASGRFLLCFKATVFGWRGLSRRLKKSQQMITCMNVMNRDLAAETRRYCAFVSIPWLPQMLNSTFNGMVWNGDNWSKLPVMPGKTGEKVRTQRLRATLFNRDELILRVLSSDVRRSCCFYKVSLQEYVRGAFAFHLPMKIEVVGLSDAWRRKSFKELLSASYFYVRRVLMSYPIFIGAILRPSKL